MPATNVRERAHQQIMNLIENQEKSQFSDIEKLVLLILLTFTINAKVGSRRLITDLKSPQLAKSIHFNT